MPRAWHRAMKSSRAIPIADLERHRHDLNGAFVARVRCTRHRVGILQLCPSLLSVIECRLHTALPTELQDKAIHCTSPVVM